MIIQLSDADKRQIADEAASRDPKTYSNKSNAIRAFKGKYPEAAKDLTNAQIVEQGFVDEDEPGKWVVNDPDPAEDDFEAGMAEELAKRNAIREKLEAAEKQAEEEAERNHPMTRAALGHGDFAMGGKASPEQDAKMAAKRAAKAADKAKGPRAPSGSSNGLKIEANRETRNGVTRPSIGGKCRGVWDMLDGIGKDATAKQAREAADGKFDKTTTMVQFYRWRKFNGIEGRK